MENNGNLCKLNVSFVLSSSAVTMLKNTMGFILATSLYVNALCKGVGANRPNLIQSAKVGGVGRGRTSKESKTESKLRRSTDIIIRKYFPGLVLHHTGT